MTARAAKGRSSVTGFTVDGSVYTAGQTATMAGVGTLVINANGSYTFTPAVNYNGPVPVATYTLSDGESSNSSTLTIGITASSPAFTDDDENVSTSEDTGQIGQRD